MHTVFVGSVAVHCVVLAAKLVFQNGVWQGEIEDSWKQLHVDSKAERNTFRAGTQSLVPWRQVWTASLSESALNRRNHDISSPHCSMVCE